MRILSFRPSPPGGGTLAHFDLELNEHLRPYSLALRQRGNDRCWMVAPCAFQERTAAFGEQFNYPLHDKVVTVTTCGRIRFNRQKINLSQVFAGQIVGIKQTDDRIWLVSFMDYDLGYFDDETCRLSNPSQIHSDPKCYLCPRNET